MFDDLTPAGDTMQAANDKKRAAEKYFDGPLNDALVRANYCVKRRNLSTSASARRIGSAKPAESIPASRYSRSNW